MVRAASLSPEESSGPNSKFAPLQLESPIGQFLSEILMSHPHLVPAAVEQQLEQFQIDRDGDKQKEEPSSSGTDLVLYRSGLYLIICEILYFNTMSLLIALLLINLAS